MLTDDFHQIPTDLIEVKPDRQRKKIEIEDLIPSIKRRGILNPIIVEPKEPSGFWLLAGERRLRTAQHLQLSHVPCRLASDLTPLEREMIELEENVRRKDLTWQEESLAKLRIHEILIEMHAGREWFIKDTAEETGFSERSISRFIKIGEALRSGDQSIWQASGLPNAETILTRRQARVMDSVLNTLGDIDISKIGSEEDAGDEPFDEAELPLDDDGLLPSGGSAGPVAHVQGGSVVGGTKLAGQAAPKAVPQPTPLAPHRIECADAIQFFSTYSGPKFNFLHCDLPYGVELNEQAGQSGFEGGGYDSNPDIYWALCRAIADGWDRVMLPSSHFVFWFSMKFYTETIAFFAEKVPSLKINPTPLVWHKTDNRGILPDANRGPRQTYEPALIGATGDRFIVKPVANSYGAPTQKSESIHTNEKPEPMLEHFLTMFVDGHTRMLDPTCGSGSAIRVAEKLGAESALGLEFNPDFAARAQERLLSRRRLAAASRASA
jgi:ParB/RepB/Spo0J family partition protein